MTHLLALLLGDRYGAGPELIARHLAGLEADPPDHATVVVGDARVLEAGCKVIGYEPQVVVADSLANARAAAGRWVLFDRPFEANLAPMGQVSRQAGEEVLSNLAFVSEAALGGAIDGIVYAPFNKQAMRLAGHEAGDELEFLIDATRPKGLTGEINILGDLWTSRVTSHVPLRDVGPLITIEAVSKGIDLIAGALQRSGRARPKIAVAALNPHGGEGGAYGREEIEVIGPAVEQARAAGLDVVGPYPSDTIFPRVAGEGIDGIVTMFHDQGQIALKLMGLGKGITLLAGLTVPVATPGHGTAYDIAGTGKALPDGLNAAISLAGKMMG